MKNNDECYEEEQLCNCVSQFSEEIRCRLVQKISDGFRGWDDENAISDLEIKGSILLAVDEASARCRLSPKPDKPKSRIWVDVANFAMFMWYRENGREKEEPKIEDD